MENSNLKAAAARELMKISDYGKELSFLLSNFGREKALGMSGNNSHKAENQNYDWKKGKNNQGKLSKIWLYSLMGFMESWCGGGWDGRIIPLRLIRLLGHLQC